MFFLDTFVKSSVSGCCLANICLVLLIKVLLIKKQKSVAYKFRAHKIVRVARSHRKVNNKLKVTNNFKERLEELEISTQLFYFVD